MRMIELMVKLLTRVLFGVNHKNYDEALAVIQTGFKDLIGLDIAVARSLTAETLVSLFRMGDSLRIEKLLGAAELMCRQTEIEAMKSSESGGISDAARAEYLKALELYLAAYEFCPDVIPKYYLDKIAELINKLGVAALPEDLQTRCKNNNLI